MPAVLFTPVHPGHLSGECDNILQRETHGIALAGYFFMSAIPHDSFSALLSTPSEIISINVNGVATLGSTAILSCFSDVIGTNIYSGWLSPETTFFSAIIEDPTCVQVSGCLTMWSLCEKGMLWIILHNFYFVY